MKDFLNECNSAKGRWNRKKFWLYPIGVSLAILTPILVLFIIAIGSGSMALFWFTGLFALIGGLYINYVSICAYIKRFHDLDRSGHYTWIAFIPYVGIIALIWCGFFKGTVGPNRFGADPLGGVVTPPIPTVNNNQEL